MEKEEIAASLQRLRALKAAKLASKEAYGAEKLQKGGVDGGVPICQFEPMDSANSFQRNGPVPREGDVPQSVDIVRREDERGSNMMGKLLGVPHPNLPENLGATVSQILMEFHAAVEEKMTMIVKQFDGKRGSSAVEEQASVTQGATEAKPRKRLREGAAPCSSTERMCNNESEMQEPVENSKMRRLSKGIEPHKDLNDTSNRSKATKPTYIYGNYPTYYSIRHSTKFDGDPRVKMFKDEWFTCRDCLDVGCHEGIITLEIVSKFCPRSMLGLDVDGGLVSRKAKKNLKAKRVEVREKPNVEDDEDIHAWKTAALASLKNTKFVVQDYGKSEGTTEAFDTITCLSVVKWIHFHHGDAGMRFVFQKFFDSLRPKGYLILEPQEWSSYQKAKRKQDMTKAPFNDLKSLKFKPDMFLDYLLKNVGFHLVESLLIQDSVKGFARPIYVMQKPDRK